ncbi:threonine-phosphate decarboxylase CobD [Halomonas elongata]|uniref:threonine-phosphate decarboxylase n=1 Tax=Halomonas elongata (strain ATCC 33173 / DSM 2581 / NBRC 15536 / NCIMB 2198 / 1H9) TaxID=768066 RepID=E1V8S6_HALED|nr:threonine-phosphate decarboxylase CobD [Halomonas elongata]WBF18942.1 threonine-phosphate decarboxylase CobD [Halomonas elongata]WPU47802.1 threonine-phosphate decarboxylase CobD [Halomonas elongata DSM 2581]WVI72445.1 threonine-phosphate decarboxylase CobD [Halomonas elongata]CBV41701.1 threonine-phosphate decarboxylase [Halomonas elongata DSM 2581]
MKNAADNAWPAHGGRIAPLLARFGLPADHPVVDFSANLNPLGPPAWLSDWLAGAVDSLTRYPDPDGTQARLAIARHEDVSLERVMVTHGGIEAIELAAAAHAGGRALIVAPTFGEYAMACRRHGLDVRTLISRGADFEPDIAELEAAMADAELLFLCRPNNPTGSLIARERVERLLARGRETRTTLVVDEAFVDFVDGDARLTPLLAEYDNLWLLRSMTKWFDVPGLRLGYLLAAPDTLDRLRGWRAPWSVNALAEALVEPLLDDVDYLAATRRWLAGQRRVPEDVRALGFTVPQTHANFFLLHGGAGTETMFEFLLRRGILARHTHNFPGLEGRWLRLALREEDDNARLLDALADWRGRR